MSGPRRGSRSGFAARLLLAQSLVLGSGALTIWLVASAVGPSIFHDHLEQAGVAHTASETRHVEEAFASALLVSIAVALVAAVVAALGVTWYLTRRVQRSVGQVADAAADIASGHYGSRVADPGIGIEFATLADSYNTLAERLEATETMRRRMLSDLAHEMRTPLATIDAHLEAVEDGIRGLDAETIRVIRDSTQRLRRLAEDVGAVSRAEEGDLTLDRRLLSAAAVVRPAAQLAQDRYAAQGVALHTRIEADEVVDVDPDRIGQILGNLLDNALRHTPRGGAVTLTCGRTGPWVEYTVADDGAGIPPEHLPHLFDRFYRVDSARDRGTGGSGIGLAIVKALAEAHGGSVTAASPGPGRGATFRVRLPIAGG